MNVLITGGLGFQGRHLSLALLTRCHNVTVLSTPSERNKNSRDALEDEIRDAALVLPETADIGSLDVVWGSVTSPVIVRSCVERANVVVHMAAIANPERCREDPAMAALVNIRGTQHVLDAVRLVWEKSREAAHPHISESGNDSCLAYGPKMLHVSTCEVYGSAQASQNEYTSPMNPPHVYSATKAAADCLARAYAREYALPITTFRPCNVYGPGQRVGEYGGVISTMTSAALTGQPIAVRGGNQAREFVHIDDLTRWYVALIERSAVDEILNLGSGERVAVLAIGEMIAALTGASLDVQPPRVSEPQSFTLNSSRARALGFVPTISFDEGLRRYVEWARENSVSEKHK